jgi:hypothetical protein
VRARIGAVLFGIGVFAVVLAAGAAFYVAPAVSKLPYDLRGCNEGETEDCLRPSVAEARNASFLFTRGGETPVVKIATGTLRSTNAPRPQADITDDEMTGDLAGKAVVWDMYNATTWVEENNAVISQYKAELALDRKTAAAVDWDGQYYQDNGPTGPSEVDFKGQLYKFPFGTEKKDYQYFDRDLRRALPIEYQGTENIQGMEVYRFQQVVPESDLTIPAEKINSLLGAFGGGATSGKVTYSNTRTIWVEPVSGNMIKVAEQQRKTLVPSTGTPVGLLNGDFVYTDETVSNNVKSAGETKDGILLIGRTLPIAAAAIGAILLIVGLILVTTGRRAASAARHRSENLETAEIKS